MMEYFRQAHHRELVGRRPGLAAGSDHLRAGDTEALDARHLRPQRRDKRSAKLIAGRLSRNDSDTQRLRSRSHLIRPPRVAGRQLAESCVPAARMVAATVVELWVLAARMAAATVAWWPLIARCCESKSR